MRASVYIEMMQELIRQHGDLEVEKWMPAKGRHEAPAPTLAHVRKFVTHRDHHMGGIGSFYHPTDNPNQKGDPVIRV